uniref:Putative ixodes 10 kDa peptide protein n=1 Tax=Ixodes ricinus TaxID=34613 RepID=A0A0K8RDL8_IXORI
MQLVVFAVALILPSFLSGESSFHTTVVFDECGLYRVEGGDRVCSAQGSGYLDFDVITCTLKCTNRKTTKLPSDVCSPGEVDCTPDVAKKLKTWAFSK